ncbi:MAG: hypothetical protein KBA86_03430 [Bacteroidales bacterium]|nr:hypothetical protein [Bacteroidales bacterium]
MTQKKIKLIAVLLLGLGLTGLQAQENINATGGNASGSGGTVSYSVGQVMYNTHIGTNGSVAEGVQQPYEISVVIGIEEAKDINLLLSAFPNPTDDILHWRYNPSYRRNILRLYTTSTENYYKKYQSSTN